MKRMIIVLSISITILISCGLTTYSKTNSFRGRVSQVREKSLIIVVPARAGSFRHREVQLKEPVVGIKSGDRVKITYDLENGELIAIDVKKLEN